MRNDQLAARRGPPLLAVPLPRLLLTVQLASMLCIVSRTLATFMTGLHSVDRMDMQQWPLL